jgi:hypothetical protein
MPEFRWNDQRSQAAQHVAERKMTIQQICDELGIDPKTLNNWKNRPEFRERVNKLVKEYADTIRNSGIGVLENRVKILDHHLNLMQQVINERANCPDHQMLPGGRTGIIVIKDRKSIPLRKDADGNTEYQEFVIAEVDTGTLSEIRQHMKQAAQELGQWSENAKIEVGKPLPRLARMKKRDRKPDDKKPGKDQ